MTAVIRSRPERPSGEGWFYSAEQQLLTQFRSDASALHSEWLELLTFSWIPPTATGAANHQADAAPQRP